MQIDCIVVACPINGHASFQPVFSTKYALSSYSVTEKLTRKVFCQALFEQNRLGMYQVIHVPTLKMHAHVLLFSPKVAAAERSRVSYHKHFPSAKQLI